MVASSFVEALVAPTDTIIKLRKTYQGESSQFPAAVSAHFKSIFSDEEAASQVRDMALSTQSHSQSLRSRLWI